MLKCDIVYLLINGDNKSLTINSSRMNSRFATNLNKRIKSKFKNLAKYYFIKHIKTQFKGKF